MIKVGSIVRFARIRKFGSPGVGIVLEHNPEVNPTRHSLGKFECVLVHWLGSNNFPPSWARVNELKVVVP